MGSSHIAQGDELGALWPPRGVGYGGWEGDARGRRYGDVCICMADSLCYKAETNTVLWSNYTPIKIYLKINKHTKIFPKLFLLQRHLGGGRVNYWQRATWNTKTQTLLRPRGAARRAAWRWVQWGSSCPGWGGLTAWAPLSKSCSQPRCFPGRMSLPRTTLPCQSLPVFQWNWFRLVIVSLAINKFLPAL